MKSYRTLFYIACTATALPQSASADMPKVYVVPAISSIRHLPDRIDESARPSRELSIIATPGEFEPASFLIAPERAVDKLELKAGALRGPDGAEIPADAINLRVVKAWYQAGTAWYSYFADPTRQELVPELLLNDENLIKVDHERRGNHLRVNGEYRWMSYPLEEAEAHFNYLTEEVDDAETLLPVAIQKGENRQFWLTLKVPDEAKAGIYQGEISLNADGKSAGSIALKVRVLPFKLPVPRTYYSLENEYLVSIYATDVLPLARETNADLQKAEALQSAIYRNLLDHNARNILLAHDFNNRKEREVAREEVRAELQLLKEAGAPLKPLIAAGWVYDSYADADAPPEERMKRFTTRIDDYIRTLKEEVGHDDIYLSTWDEGTEAQVKVFRELVEHTQDEGMKVWMTTAKGRHLNLAGYAIDYANHGGWPDRAIASKWHAIGGKVASYAGPHTGPENPDVFRRWEGLARYKENYDGSFNYKYISQLHLRLYKSLKSNVWNDLGTEFRGFNMVYPTHRGVIDTLAWEGFREGIDDVRYATLLKQEAEKAMNSGNGNARRVARKALIRLELLDAKTADLNTARQEIIESILKIKNANAKATAQ